MHETKQFLKFVYQGAQPIIELRARCGDGRWRHGLFTDWTEMSRIAHSLEEKHGVKSLYYTLNPVKPEVVTYPKGLNKFTPLHKFSPCVGNHHIANRLLYLVDIDSVHTKDMMATADEHNQVWPVMEKVLAHLRLRGWPDPVIIDSGNGCHMLFRGDGCDATSKYWEACLDWLSKEFSTKAAKVDAAMFNAGRISRLPGCMNRKGEDTPERPHRKAYVVSYPAKWEPLPAAEVFRLAVDKGCDPNPKKKSSSGSRIADEDMRDLFDEFPDQLELVSMRRKGDATYYDIVCPFNGPHSGDPGKTSIIMGPDGFGFKCMSDDCVGIDRNDLMELLRQNDDGLDPWVVLYGIKERHCAKWGITLDEMYADMEAVMAPVRNAGQKTTQELITAPESGWAELYAMREQLLKETPEWEFDAETWDLIDKIDWSRVTTDPAVWCVPEADVANAWFDQFIPDKSKQYSSNVKVLAADLGAETMFYLARLRQRPDFVEPPPRFLTGEGFDRMAG